MASFLIVDDSYIMRMKIKAMLINMGHAVVGEAANGEQAISEYTQKRPDIVTMDISMPVMDGILALKMIISRFPDARVIVISALDKKNMVFTALESGARNYILKPIDEVKLLKTIETVLKDEKPRKIVLSQNNGAPAPVQSFNLESELISPFSVDNRNGTFVINIRDTINIANFSTLAGAIQSFLYIKPLSIVFNFGSGNDLDDEILNRVRKLVSAVMMVGGNVKLAAQSGDMRERLNGSIPGVQIIQIG